MRPKKALFVVSQRLTTYVSLATAIATIVVLLFAQGCAANRPIPMKDMTSLSPLKVVRYTTPEIKKQTFLGVVVGSTLAVQLTFGFGAGSINEAIAKSGGKESQKVIYDLGYLVMTRFADRASKEIPDWPKMIIVDQVIKETPKIDGHGLLEYRVGDIRYGWLHHKFISTVTATMKNTAGDVVWQRTYIYRARNFNRGRDAEEYEANDARLLKEEILFAADKTVEDFIGSLKNRN